MLCLNKIFSIGILLVNTEGNGCAYFTQERFFYIYTWLEEYYKLKLEYILKFKMLKIIMNCFLEQTYLLKQ